MLHKKGIEMAPERESVPLALQSRRQAPLNLQSMFDNRRRISGQSAAAVDATKEAAAEAADAAKEAADKAAEAAKEAAKPAQ